MTSRSFSWHVVFTSCKVGRSYASGSKLYARLKVAAVEVASVGALEPSLETDRAIQVVEERDYAYCKLVLGARRYS